MNTPTFGHVLTARAIVLSLCVALSCAAARADDSTPSIEPESGDSLVQQAVAAYANGDLVRARALFEEAHFSAPTARTLRGLGVLAYRERRFTDAVPLLEASLGAQEKPLTPELRTGVQRLLEASQAQIARLSLALVPESAEVTANGASVARTRDGTLVLAPGPVTLRAAATGYATRELSLVLVPGEQRALAIVLTTTPSTAAAVSAAARGAPLPVGATTAPTRGAQRQSMRRWAYGLTAACGAALVSTAITAGLGAARVNAANASCRDNADSKCTGEEQAQLAEHHKLSLLAALTNAGAVIAGVSGTASITLWVFARRTESAERSRAPALGVGLGARF